MVARNINFQIRANDFFSPALQKLAKNLSTVENRYLRKYNTRVKNIQTNISKLNKQRLDKFANVLTSLAGVRGFLGLTKAAEEFQKEFVSVAKVLNVPAGESEKNIIGKTKKDILDLSKTIPLTLTEISKVAESGAKIGLVGENLKTYTGNVAKISAALSLSTEEAGKQIAKISTMFSIDNKDQDKIALVLDSINHLADSTKANGPEIINILQRISSATSLLEIDPVKAAGMAAAVEQVTRSPEIAGSNMTRILNQLDIPEFADFLKEGEVGFRKILGQFAAMDKESRKIKLKEVFKEGEDYNVINALVNNLKNYDTTMKQVADQTKYAGSVQREFEKSSETLAAKKQLLRNSLARFSVSLQPVIVLMTKMAVVFSKVVDKVTAFSNANPKLFSGLVIIVGIILALVAVFTSLSFVLTNIVLGFMSFKLVLAKLLAYKAVIALIGGIKIALAGLATVLGVISIKLILIGAVVILIVAAIAGIGYGIYKLIKHWDVVVKYYKETMENMANFFSWLGNKIYNFFAGIFRKIIKVFLKLLLEK